MEQDKLSAEDTATLVRLFPTTLDQVNDLLRVESLVRVFQNMTKGEKIEVLKAMTAKLTV